MSNDLGYTLKDRKKNALRIIKLSKYLSDQKVNVIISANLVFQNYRNWCKKNIPSFLEVYIESKKELLIKRNKKKIFYRLKKNVLGVDINVKKPHKPHLIINNNYSKIFFLKSAKLLDKLIRKKKVKIH
jgi:cytidine diphosphoramidate kinase